MFLHLFCEDILSSRCSLHRTFNCLQKNDLFVFGSWKRGIKGVNAMSQKHLLFLNQLYPIPSQQPWVSL